MATYDELAKRLPSAERFESGTGTTDADIAEAEKALGVPIRGAYRRFLREFGWARINHVELFGLGPGLPDDMNLVHVTRRERDELEPALQAHLLPLENDGGGNLYCLDTLVLDEPTVVFWDHEQDSNQVPEVVAIDFVVWLEEITT